MAQGAFTLGHARYGVDEKAGGGNSRWEELCEATRAKFARSGFSRFLPFSLLILFSPPILPALSHSFLHAQLYGDSHRPTFILGYGSQSIPERCNNKGAGYFLLKASDLG